MHGLKVIKMPRWGDRSLFLEQNELFFEGGAYKKSLFH